MGWFQQQYIWRLWDGLRPLEKSSLALQDAMY